MIDSSAILYAVVSGIVFLASYGLVAAAALHVADGRVGWRQATGVLRRHGLRFALWAVGLGLLVAVGFAVYTVPGLIVLALTPFLLLAALDGQANPLAANFRTIGRRFWRWLVTTIVTGVVVIVGALGSGLFTFFTRGSFASLIVWLVAGFVLVWFTTAWALIYRAAAATSD
jgi:hypothetical protein